MILRYCLYLYEDFGPARHKNANVLRIHVGVTRSPLCETS